MPQYNVMQTIKRRFFAMRNGVIADTLRRAGLDYHIIFGLNLPQIVEIAGELEPSVELAEQLWTDRRTRENLLLAPMLYPVEMMDTDSARRWLGEATTTEVADVLCLKLLRRHPDAAEIAIEAMESGNEMIRYSALRLMLNLLAVSPDAVQLACRFKALVEANTSRNSLLTLPILRQLSDEISWLTEEK